MDRIVRVVRGDLDRAWNETRPGQVLGESEQAAFREAQIWFWPHAFARAAAYAEQDRCPDGSDCEVRVEVAETDGSTAITVEIDGNEYRGTPGDAKHTSRARAKA